jgi:hypothetical protein
MRNTILPAAVVVSMRSESDTRSAPALLSLSLIANASFVERARRDRQPSLACLLVLART